MFLLLLSPKICFIVSRFFCQLMNIWEMVSNFMKLICYFIAPIINVKRYLPLDFFDGSINRIGAYVIGSRAAQKCMTRALLEPTAQLSRYELEGKGFQVLGLLEEAKALPWNAVYDEFCQRNDVPVGADFIAEIEQYEKDVTSKR